MKLRIGIAALLVTGAVAAIGVTLAQGGSRQAPDQTRWGTAVDTTVQAEASAPAAVPAGASRLNLVEVFSPNFSDIDVGEPGFSPGDYNVFDDPLFDDDQTQRVGKLHASCLITTSTDLCRATLEVTKGDLRGKVTLDGTAGEPPFLLAITGGTGDFRKLRGQARLTPVSPDAFRIDLLLWR